MERVAFVVDVRSPAGRSELEGREVADLLDQVVALPDPARRQEARAALASAGPTRLEALREGISQPCWRVRRWSCRVLADEALDGRTIARLVVAARGDPHKKVRRQALDALVGWSYMPRCKAAEGLDVGYDLIGLLLDRLRNDRSVSVRRAAATGLLHQVVLNANRERRVRRGLRRAIAGEQDGALCGRAQQALSSMGTVEQTDEYAAVRWALAGGRVEQALQLVRGHLLQRVGRGGVSEAREWMHRVLAVSDGAPPWLLAAAQHDAGLAALINGDLVAAARHLEASLAQWSVAGEHGAGVRTKSLLALVRSFGEDPAVVQDLEGDVAEVRATGDDASLFDVLTACGHARNFRGAPHLARGHFEEAVAVARRAGLDDRIAHALVGLGSAELGQGEYAAAEAHLDEAVARSEAWDDASTEVVGHCWAAELDRLRGDSRSARARLESCVERARTMGTPSPLAVAVLGLGRAAHEEGTRTGQVASSTKHRRWQARPAAPTW